MEIPAEYKTVRKKVMVKPPTTRKIEIPAAYETVKVKKMVSPPKEVRIPIPAEYQTVTKTEKIAESKMEWRRVLCETNMSRKTIMEVQRALLQAGHSPGPIDGVIGPKTNSAIKSYQREKGLAVGQLTYETLEKLGIFANR